eukprot:TRINITY_DN8673_c0_g1_i2.p1 TRINITY_DN8673_c0_g1~~TRINITY_DN8673_c0_g1_i2.p1  ORF type:complete len:216 (-),score=25.57 TRINITY_DN8673_c0_g1_i2:143-790(-)
MCIRDSMVPTPPRTLAQLYPNKSAPRSHRQWWQSQDDPDTPLEPKGQLQLCYQLTPGRSLAPEKDPGLLGALQVAYRGPMGSLGNIRMAIVRLPRNLLPPDSGGIEVTIPELPGHSLTVGVPTPLAIRVWNRSSNQRKLNLELRTEQMAGVLLNGVSGQALGEVPPNGYVEVWVDLLPLLPGIHPLAGVYVLDVESFQRSECGEIGAVLVSKPQP